MNMSRSITLAADGFDVGRVGARGRKSKNMLNRDVGLTDLNCGRCAYLSGALKPYKVLIEQMQRTELPEQHLMARRIRHFYMVMKQSWVGTPESEPMFACRAFQEWQEEMLDAGKTDLVKLVKQECRAFSSVLVSSIKERLKTTWNYLQALELIDPLGPDLDRYVTPELWEALNDLCDRRDIDFHNCQEQILEMRANVPNLSAIDKAMIQADLRGYLQQRHQSFVVTLTPSPTPEYDTFCTAVFAIPLTSAFVETLFSKMNYNQHKIRNRLRDDTMSSILHVHDAVVPDPQRCLPSDLSLKVSVRRSLSDRLRMEKRIGERVCDVFQGERFHGEITEIIFHEIHAQYMYHVRYEDDDVHDYWRHELELIICRCEDSTSTDDDST